MTEKSTDIEVDLVPRVENVGVARVRVLRDVNPGVNIEIDVQLLPCHDQNQQWKRRRFPIVKRTNVKESRCLGHSRLFHVQQLFVWWHVHYCIRDEKWKCTLYVVNLNLAWFPHVPVYVALCIQYRHCLTVVLFNLLSYWYLSKKAKISAIKL